MAVADDAVKLAQPPARIAVPVLALVRFVLAAMLAFGGVAARALPYLFFGTGWLIPAGSAARIVASHACREGSAILVFLDAFCRDVPFTFFICILFFPLALAAVRLCGSCLAVLVAVGSGSGSEFEKQSAYEAITWEPTEESPKLPRAVIFGYVADLAFMLLSVSGFLLAMMSSPVEGSISQGEMIGSVIKDVGIFGIHVTNCFVIFPALALDIFRDEQPDEKAVLTAADC